MRQIFVVAAAALLASACGDTVVVESTNDGADAASLLDATSPTTTDATDAGSSSDANDGAPPQGEAGPGCTGCRDYECCKDGACWPGSGDYLCGGGGATCAACDALTGCRQIDTNGVGISRSCVAVRGDGSNCTEPAQCKGSYCIDGKCAGAACVPAAGTCIPGGAFGCCGGLHCGGASPAGGLGACCYPKGTVVPIPAASPGPLCCDSTAVLVQGTTWTCM